MSAASAGASTVAISSELVKTPAMSFVVMTFPLPDRHHSVYGVSTNCQIDFWIVLLPLASLQRSPAACRHVPPDSADPTVQRFPVCTEVGYGRNWPGANGRAEQVRS